MRYIFIHIFRFFSKLVDLVVALGVGIGVGYAIGNSETDTFTEPGGKFHDKSTYSCITTTVTQRLIRSSIWTENKD